MRRDDEAGELLVGIVGQREHDPGRLSARLEGADLDAPHDAVGARRGRDLNAVALRAVVLDGGGEVDRVGVGRHAHRLNGGGRLTADEHPAEKGRQPTGAAPVSEDFPNARDRLNQVAWPRLR